MIRDRNIVCVASGWWDHPTGKHHVMRLLAECNDVVWIGFHGSRRPSLTTRDAGAALRRLRRIVAGPRAVASRLRVLTPLVLPLPSSPRARRFNVWALRRQIAAALRSLPRRPTQLWLFTPDVPELAEACSWERVVYFCVDEFAAFDGYDARLIDALELRTLRRADVTLATSPALLEARRPETTTSHYAPHGVDFEHFAKARARTAASVPADLRDIPGPRFGYFGLLGAYVDLDLLARVARRRADWSFVLIGDAGCDLAPLERISNVHILGGRPYESLPAYSRGLDVGLIPFRMSRLTRAVNPIKLREYLAAGLPVISAPLPAAMEFAPHVLLAQTPDELIAAGELALRSRSDQDARARQERVRGDSWRARVEEFSRWVMAAGVRDEGHAPSGTPGERVAAGERGTAAERVTPGERGAAAERATPAGATG